MIHPKAVFFDWDGTLADSYQCIEGAHDHALAELGLAERETGWFRDYFGKPREYIYDTIYGDQRAEAQAIFEAYLQAHHTRLVQPIVGAKALLDGLQSMGVMMGIVTNKRKDFVQAEVESFGWAHYFASVVGAGEAEADKPSAAPLHLALQRAGYDGAIGDVWFVGDTQADIDCAAEAGAKALFYGDDRDESHVILSFRDYGAFVSLLQGA